LEDALSGPGSEIWFLNRGLVILRPREPFVTWVREEDPAEDPLDDDTVRAFTAAYLIPQFESDEDSREWIRHNATSLFEFTLNEWYTDESMWPKARNWITFQEWFRIEFIDLVWDLVDEPLTSDPEAPEHQLD